MDAAPSPARARLALALLTLVYVVNFVDRQLVGIVGQPMKTELGLSDLQLGLLSGPAFALFYTVLGLPIARLAERRSRVGIVAVSLALWSLMTAACGSARSYPALFLCRVGVGIGEAGCAPPAQSLIAELTPADRRATALSIFSLGVPLGMLFGAVASGWIAQTLGWRAAFVALGLPGLALALVVRVALRDPQRRSVEDDAVPPLLMDVARGLLQNPAARHMAIGASLASFAGYGLTGFAVPLLMRSYALPLGQAATGFGLVVGVAVGLGIGGGGALSDRLSSRSAPGLVAATGTLLAAILFQAAFGRPTPVALGIAAFVPMAAAHLYFGPTYGVIVNAVAPRARATAIALLLMAMNGIGLGLGPLVVGALSDHFLAACGNGAGCSATALTHALRLDLIVYFWATLHFWLAAHALRGQPQSRAR